MVDTRKYPKRPIVGVGAAVFDGASVVLIKRRFEPLQGRWSLPGGGLEVGETLEAGVAREIEEETGYKAKKMTHLITYYPSVGYNTEAIHCFVASGLTRGKMNLDSDEFITVKKMELPKLIKLIKSGKIIDSKTICAVMIYAAKKKMI